MKKTIPIALFVVTNVVLITVVVQHARRHQQQKGAQHQSPAMVIRDDESLAPSDRKETCRLLHSYLFSPVTWSHEVFVTDSGFEAWYMGQRRHGQKGARFRGVNRFDADGNQRGAWRSWDDDGKDWKIVPGNDEALFLLQSSVRDENGRFTWVLMTERNFPSGPGFKFKSYAARAVWHQGRFLVLTYNTPSPGSTCTDREFALSALAPRSGAFSPVARICVSEALFHYADYLQVLAEHGDEFTPLSELIAAGDEVGFAYLLHDRPAHEARIALSFVRGTDVQTREVVREPDILDTTRGWRSDLVLWGLDGNAGTFAVRWRDWRSRPAKTRVRLMHVHAASLDARPKDPVYLMEIRTDGAGPDEIGLGMPFWNWGFYETGYFPDERVGIIRRDELGTNASVVARLWRRSRIPQEYRLTGGAQGRFAQVEGMRDSAKLDPFRVNFIRCD